MGKKGENMSYSRQYYYHQSSGVKKMIHDLRLGDKFITFMFYFILRIGRSNDEQRKVYLQTGVISQAKGSAYLEIGDTKVDTVLHKPRAQLI